MGLTYGYNKPCKDKNTNLYYLLSVSMDAISLIIINPSNRKEVA